MSPNLKQHLKAVKAETPVEDPVVVLVFQPRPGHTLSEIEKEVEAYAESLGVTALQTTHDSEPCFQITTESDDLNIWEW